MKRLSKALSSILLAASIAVGTIQTAEMTGVTASAAYTYDLKIGGSNYVTIKPEESMELQYIFSGDGIAAFQIITSDNISCSITRHEWYGYPSDCYCDCVISSLDGNGGEVQFILLDGDMQPAKTFTTKVDVDKYAEINVDDISFPTEIEQGKGQHISGCISSTMDIDKISAYVFNSNSEKMFSTEVYPYGKEYQLYNSKIDWDLPFGTLEEGNYKLTIDISSGGTSSKRVFNFNVKKAQSEASISFSDMYFPSSIDEGNGQHISGTINSTENIDTVQAVVYNSDSNAVLSAKRYPNSKSFSLYDSDLDWALSFSQLSPGDYTLTYFVASGSAARSYTHNFTVKAKEVPVPVVSFENMSFPSSFEKGTDPVMNGNIISTQNVDYLSIEVRDRFGNIVLHSYNDLAWWYITLQGSGMNTDIDFSKLDEGDYTITYYATSGLGRNTYTQYFTVKPAYKPDPVITFSSMSFPESLNKGNGQHISGTISSTDKIDTVQAVVTDSSGKVWLNTKRYLNQNSYSLFNSDIDWDLSFSTLPVGNYKLTYFVASGATDRSYTHNFTVKTNEPAAPTVTFSGMYFPENIDVGKGQHIKGTVYSSAAISKLQAVIKDSSGNTIKSVTKYPNTKSYSLYDSALDWALPFSTLPVGNYKLTYFVSSGTTDKSYTHNFTVRNNKQSAPTVTFGGMYFPENIDVGKGQHIKGAVYSSAAISKLQAVIKDNNGNTIKSVTKYPNAKSYSLYDSALDWDLPFSKLSAGSYTLTYTAVSGKTTESYTHKFSVGKKSTGKLNLKKGFEYCDEWWDKRNSAIWPNSGSDCSNFASQFLWASGMQTDSKFTPGSRTVLAFDNLKKYLYNTYGVKTIMRKKYSDCLAVEEGFASYKSNLSCKDIAPGDLIVMIGYDSHGKKINDGHIMIVYKVEGSEIYCYGHSNDKNGKTNHISDSNIQGVVKTSVLFG